jgi:uncharacterized protein (DUF1800 family)
MTRREMLVGGAGLLTLAGCSRVIDKVAARPLPDKLALPPNPGPAARLLNRAGFGPRPGEIAMATDMGLDKWLDDQLHPSTDDDPVLMLNLARFEALSTDSAELEDIQEGPVMKELGAAAILRATYSRHQLRERMVDLWTNHFNIYAQKAHGAYKKPTDDLKVIRENALGSFPEMVKASAKSPAMLTYLDNQVNEFHHPNENYARELMELHTLGVHGGYSQQDVMEVARCFTGWTVEDRFLRPKGQFRFNEDAHDKGEKHVLGHVIPAGGGIEDAEQVLDILATHPSTARFISGKLCRAFLGTTDSPWVDKLSDFYLKTNGDISSMLRPLLLSSEVLEGAPIAKRPFDYMVSALRVTGATTDGEAVQTHLSNMGQPLYGWPMPDGYPERAAAWSGSMLGRWNFATDLVKGKIGGTHNDSSGLLSAAHDDNAHAAVIAVLGRNPDAADPMLLHLRQASADPSRLIALALSSPEFQYK